MSDHTTPEVDRWAEDLPEAFLLCRDMGHTWRAYRAAFEAAENAYWRELRCNRCLTRRTQWLSLSGHVMRGNTYTYPEGYTAPSGAGRMDGGGRDALRLVSVLRTVEKSTKKAG